MRRGYLVVEGHGDLLAAANIVHRLWNELGLEGVHWAEPIRGKNLHQERGIQKASELVRGKGNACLLLLLRDEDDACPRLTGPQAAGWLTKLRLPFPAAVVLLHREFESLFLPCLSVMAGKPLSSSNMPERAGLLPEASFRGDPESIRGVKEWLSKHMPQGRSYKPTVDQLPLTRMIDFSLLRSSIPPLPCFGSLERSLRFLAKQMELGAQGVYPSPP